MKQETEMLEKIIISGFGGQGVLSAGLIVAESAVHIGLEATFYPSYGIEMRGGTANCHVILSNRKIASPIISIADTLIAFNEPSIIKFLPKVKTNGLVIVNSSVIKSEFDYGGRRVLKVPMETLALERLGKLNMANVIMIGTYLKEKAIIALEEVKRSIWEKFNQKGENIVQLNYKALELGYQLI